MLPIGCVITLKSGKLHQCVTITSFRVIHLAVKLAVCSGVKTEAWNFICRSNQKTSCNHHKKVGRSRSHRPRLTSEAVVSTIPEGVKKGLPVMSRDNFAEKPALRKHHSFPYETFNNETSYSSDDSINNQPR